MGALKDKKNLHLMFFLILACIAAGIVVITNVVFGGERQIPIYCVDTEEKVVAISFDAAWGNEFTEGILDILDTYDVKATFFLVNFWAEKYPEDVVKIAERGHDIGNHSATHPDMADLSDEQICQELITTGDTIEKLTGQQPVLFRPPFGSYSDSLITNAKQLGYETIQWSIDSLDWKDISTEQIVERVTRNVKNGSIILFHNNAQHVLEYLPLILDNLKENGYEVVKINDMIYHENAHVNEQGCQVQEGGF
ncbi:MAG: polysaccharide deacetylase family protein [Anaerovoracaceae bacterium]